MLSSGFVCGFRFEWGVRFVTFAALFGLLLGFWCFLLGCVCLVFCVAFYWIAVIWFCLFGFDSGWVFALVAVPVVVWVVSDLFFGF